MPEADDPLKPPEPVFDEAWQAQTLAMADTMVQQGRFSADDWAQALGAELEAAAKAGKPDTLETYYLSALDALEKLAVQYLSISDSEQKERKSDWTKAYLNTPHGKPVKLSAAKDARN